MAEGMHLHDSAFENPTQQGPCSHVTDLRSIDLGGASFMHGVVFLVKWSERRTQCAHSACNCLEECFVLVTC